MSVYVDTPIHEYKPPRGRKMIMCHMVADTPEELHDMATRIGMKREWFQSKASTPHYDVCKSKRALAVSFGAIEVDPRGIVKVIKRLRETKVFQPNSE